MVCYLRAAHGRRQEGRFETQGFSFFGDSALRFVSVAVVPEVLSALIARQWSD